MIKHFKRESVLAPRILGGVGQALGLVVGNIGDAEVFEHLKQCLAAVGKCHRTVVGVTLLDQHMAVETTHLGNGKDADAAKAAGGNGQHLTLRDVGAQSPLAVALEPIEGDLAGGDVALQRTAGEIRLTARRLQQTVLNELVLDAAATAHLAAWGVAAVEAHEGVLDVVVELARDILIVDVFGHGVVDIQ